jgi:CheY-like chemotaxis protein
MGLEEQFIAREAYGVSLARSGGLPHPAAKAVASASERAAAKLDSDAPNVLVVEDNLVNQLVALEFLTLLGVRARLAIDGEEALTMCKTEAPALVLMDIQMPGLDGLETTRRLRAMQREGHLPPFPVIALSALGQDSDLAASRAAGMDAHLVKPVDFSQLSELVSRWLRLPRAS